jgi:hypothetical protein
MISYKDMTFCSAQCRNLDCPRNYTDDIHLAARQLWGSEGAPVAFADFSKDCKDYKPV